MQVYFRPVKMKTLAPAKKFWHGSDMLNTPEQIIAYIGRAEVCRALGITDSAVRMALKSGVLPGIWLNTLEEIAGRPLPRDAFHWRKAKGAE